MRVHIAWPILFALLSIFLFSVVLYQKSAIPKYREAERLQPTLRTFAQDLAKLQEESGTTPSDIANIMAEPRFDKIRPYGIKFLDHPKWIISIRINDRFSFDVGVDGSLLWIEKP